MWAKYSTKRYYKTEQVLLYPKFDCKSTIFNVYASKDEIYVKYVVHNPVSALTRNRCSKQ